MMTLLILFAAKYLYLGIILIGIVTIFFAQSRERIRLFFLSLISFPASYIIAKIASHFFYNPRPFVTEHITPLLIHAADNGFPSDHTLISAVIASVIFSFNKKVGILLFILTLLVGLGRVLVHIHHFVDILASIVIASLVTYLTLILLRKYYPVKTTPESDI